MSLKYTHGPASVAVHRQSSSLVHNAQTSFSQNLLADQSQILCGASVGRGNEILFVESGSRDQDGRHPHIL